MNEYKRPVISKAVGGMWDESKWEIHLNVELSTRYTTPCPHCHTPRKDDKGENHVTCPRVVVAENEGGFNSTGICLDCIIEAATELK